VIPVTRINGKTYFLNAIFIETIEETPDTIITMTNGKKFIVMETAQEVVANMQYFLRGIGLLAASNPVEKADEL
jgi:flagellar protein FlbD